MWPQARAPARADRLTCSSTVQQCTVQCAVCAVQDRAVYWSVVQAHRWRDPRQEHLPGQGDVGQAGGGGLGERVAGGGVVCPGAGPGDARRRRPGTLCCTASLQVDGEQGG